MYDVIETNMKSVVDVMPEYKGMLESIKENLPEIYRASSLFYKRQSQFMDNMLTLSKVTPIRNIHQILAQITRRREAIEENYYKLKRKKIELRILKEKYENLTGANKDLVKVDIEEKEFQIRSIENYMGGSIRQVTNYVAQYNSILKSMGVKEFNEIDFENEEERYHIMTAFDQALTAARANPSQLIDEGNHIYLNQIGINGTTAQIEVSKFLRREADYIQAKNILMNASNYKPEDVALAKTVNPNAEDPSHKMVLEFLNNMAEKFKGCSKPLAEYKGMSVFTESAALKKGDTRFKIEE